MAKCKLQIERKDNKARLCCEGNSIWKNLKIFMKSPLLKTALPKVPGKWTMCQKLREANLNDHKYRVESLDKRKNKWHFLNICMWLQYIEADKQVKSLSKPLFEMAENCEK